MTPKPSDPSLVQRITARLTTRDRSLFALDLAERSQDLIARVAGRSVLVIGGAGSIGSATIRKLLRWSPSEVTIVDLAENNLVELLRSLRSSQAHAHAPVRIEPIDYGSPIMERFLADHPRFDLVLNFAAVKHVRSERDEVSLLHLIDTNLLKADRLLGWLRRHRHGRHGVFFVSSDKAANPANVMGASKRLMEHLLFWHAAPAAEGHTLRERGAGHGPPLPVATSARFANVAFSDGSLPWAFLQRVAQQQPLSGPSDIRRYLISLEEAGDLCAIASLLCPSRHVLVPRLDPESNLVDFREIAIATLELLGYAPRWCESEDEARSLTCGESGQWPCYFAPTEAMGEKPSEEFVGRDERTIELESSSTMAIPYAHDPDTDLLRSVFRDFERWVSDPSSRVRKSDILDAIRSVVPTLEHVDSNVSLDARM